MRYFLLPLLMLLFTIGYSQDVQQVEVIKSDRQVSELLDEIGNQELKLDLSKVQPNNKTIDNQNNYGSQSYDGLINKIGNYKFSKLENINQLNIKPIFLDGESL